jgi:hypothetical protein
MGESVDPRTGAFKVTVDGRELTLLCDFNTMCDFQEASGQDAMSFINDLNSDKEPDLFKARLLIHCMLLQTHEDATLRDAGRVLTVAPLAMIDAVGAGMPDIEDDELADGDALGEGVAA